MNLLSSEEVAACVVNTEPYALKNIDPEVLNHLIQYAAMLGAEKTNPKREPLTDEELKHIQDANWVECEGGGYDWNTFSFARAIEAAHGIKGEA